MDNDEKKKKLSDIRKRLKEESNISPNQDSYVEPEDNGDYQPIIETGTVSDIIDDTSMDHRSSRSRRRHPKSFSFDASKWFVLNRLVKLAIFGFIAVVIAIPLMFLWYSRDLPTPGKLITSKYKDATRIYDRKGVLLYSFYQDENRTYVKLNDIPKDLQNATIAVEDKNFYKNSGFSVTGILRAFVESALTLHIAGGGSTITQQLVKNVLLTNQQTLPRKIKELILAIQVDHTYTKDQILEMYLNNIPYGGTAIGVEAGAQQYFGKNVNELDLAQCAFLAGLPQNPSVYSPFISGQTYYLGRTQAVLHAMVVNGYITQTQADKSYLEIKNYKFSQKQTATIKAPHFVMYVRQLLAQQFGEQMVTNGGLQVTTSLDYDTQQHAEQIVKDEVDKNGPALHFSNGAAIVRDPKTGEILAMVGSKDYFDEKIDGNYNVAVSNSPGRQPGSSLKPIMYAAAFEKGYTPATVVFDAKTDFPQPNSVPDTYSPVNYDSKFHGPVQIRYALANSFNIPAVKMLARVGIKNTLEKGYQMGISNWNPTSDTLGHVGLSLVLGGREVSLLDETTAYGVFANSGVRQDPVAVLKVTDSQGHTLFQHQNAAGKQVLSKEIAFLISHILLDNSARVQEFGAYSSLVVPGKTVSAKTGTTDMKRDNWTLGYTPSVVVGVWVGNNNNEPMDPHQASGITGAAPIWNKLMSYVLKGKPDEQPQKPDDVNALQIDSFAGGLPHGGLPTRSEYFIKGTEPTTESPIYKSKDGQDYYVFHEDDPVSTDGQNRWQASRYSVLDTIPAVRQLAGANRDIGC